MFKISHVIFVIMAVWTAGLLFWTSQSVQQAQKELRSIKQSSYNETEMVRVLSSEWNYLNRPERLEALAKDYLVIDNVKVDNAKLLTSVDLIKDIAPVIIDENQPVLNIKKLVSQRKVQSKVADKKGIVISKPEQDNFNSFIGSLSEEGRE